MAFPRVRDWRVRTRLGAVLLLPALSFALVTGAYALSAVGDAVRSDEFTARIAVDAAAADLVHQAQLERDAARPSSPDTVAATDAAAQRLLQAATDAGLDEVAWQEAFRTARTSATPEAYDAFVEQLLGMTDEATIGIDDAAMVNAVTVAAELARVKESVSHLRAFGRSYLAGDFVDGSRKLAQLRDARSWSVVRFERVWARLAPEFVPLDAAPQVGVTGLDRLADQLTTGTVDAAQWWQAASAEVNQWRAVETALTRKLADGARSRSTSDWARTISVFATILFVLLVTLTLSVFIGRSMIVTLRQLRLRALSIADRELPDTLARLRDARPHDPLPEPPEASPTAHDEIGEVAAAFNAVHRSAFDLALQQTRSRHAMNAIFMNLARRSQVLVERQLRHLDEMERDERDPDRLSALFRLDHLAARMRRNDENLLVLAGAESRRRWHEAVPLAALALAALAEIEQYERVRADIDHRLYVNGHVAEDLVHLVAELLDNATSFSAPHTAVQVTARAERDGATLEISDEGIGLSAGNLAAANELLAAPPNVDVATSERMGLVVVSHLAARHNVKVYLASTGRGVRVKVWLPGHLMTEPEPVVTTPAVPAPRAFVPRVAPQSDTRSGQPAAPPSYGSSGLPVRVPRATQAPAERRPSPAANGTAAKPRHEPDPETTAATLTRLHDGVRRGMASRFDEDDPLSDRPINNALGEP